LCSLGSLLLLAGSAAATEVEAVQAGGVFRLEEVEAGQRGFGISVFSGYQPERFEVEVLGVWRRVEPDSSYILVRLAGQGLEESGVVAGMSGSPVYLDGRLAGAVRFAWPFSVDAIAGITPIETMRELSSTPSLAARAGRGGSVELIDLAAAKPPPELLARQLDRLAVAPLEGAGPGLPWSAIGFGAETRTLLARTLGSVAPAGRAVAGGPVDLIAGSAVAAVLVDGDLQLAVTGTVTERDGDQILAFGHPFLATGPVEIPMAAAEVIAVLSNQLSSFKITNLGEVVGAFDLDRMTGVRGRLGAQAAMTPMQVEIEGERSQRLDLRMVREPMVTPSLVAISVLGSLEVASRASGPQGLDLAASFDLGQHGELRISQSFDSESAGVEAAIYLLAFADYLLNNPLAQVALEAIEVRLIQHRRPRIARLVEAHASKTLVRPGDTVGLNLDLIPYRGDRQRRSLEVQIPTSIPDGRYSLLVGDGVSIDVARLTVEQTAPVTFPQAMKFLRSLHSRREVVVLGVIGGEGLAVAGEVLPRLPGSIQSLWTAAASSSATPLRLAIAQEQGLELDVPVEGAIRVDLEVRRQGPLAPETKPPAGAEASAEENGQ
jgi:hypothetical protein